MYMNIGERLSELRYDLGLKQKEVSNILGVPISTLGSWETDASHPPLEKIVALSQLYHVSADYILGLTDEAVCWEELQKKLKIGASDISIKALLKEFFMLNEENQKLIWDFIQFIKHRKK